MKTKTLPALLILVGCATTPLPVQPSPPNAAVVHRHCAEEMERAVSSSASAGYSFTNVALSEECRRDFLFALNQSFGGG